jgi:hypothetical protein
MTLHQRRARLRLQIVTATMRRDWAIAEVERNPTTPALTKFVEDSREECRALKAELDKLNRTLKLKSPR